MGRPINERKIGFGPGRIAVTRHNIGAPGNEATTAAHILKQKSSNKFLVRLDSDSGNPAAGTVLTLTNADNGAMPANSFRIDIDGASDSSAAYRVTKLFNRTVEVWNDVTEEFDRGAYNIGDWPDDNADVPNKVVTFSVPAQ